MREIISLQIGQCGNQVGAQFWERISQEHGVNESGRYIGNMEEQLQYINSFFSESSTEQYVPRSVLIDLEPGILDHVRSSHIGALFRPDNFIFGRGGAGNNFAKGYHTEGAELLDYVLEAVRREAEACDCMQGFQVINSLGGGTGSGMGTLILQNLRQEYPDRIIQTYSILPSSKVSETVVENSNAILALHHLLDVSDMTFCMDNQALYKICSNTLKMSSPSLPDLNQLIALAMTGFTASFRFPSHLSADLRKLSVSMVPFPRLHFFIPGFSPLTARSAQGYRRFTVQNLIYQLFEPGNLMVDINTANGKYITASGVFRGRMSTQQVEHHLFNLMNKNSKQFVDWLPTNLKIAVCNIPPVGMKQSVSFIANNTAIVDVWRRIQSGFKQMFRKKAYVHWYTGEGLEESEFKESSKNLTNLVCEYKQYESMTFFMNNQDKNHGGEKEAFEGESVTHLNMEPGGSRINSSKSASVTGSTMLESRASTNSKKFHY